MTKHWLWCGLALPILAASGCGASEGAGPTPSTTPPRESVSSPVTPMTAAPSQSVSLPPSPPGGTRMTIRTHCGVISTTFEGALWLADPPLGDDSGNPPEGWGENDTSGYFVVMGPKRAEFHADSGETAAFRRAPAGTDDPAAGCE